MINSCFRLAGAIVGSGTAGFYCEIVGFRGQSGNHIKRRWANSLCLGGWVTHA